MIFPLAPSQSILLLYCTYLPCLAFSLHLSYLLCFGCRTSLVGTWHHLLLYILSPVSSGPSLTLLLSVFLQNIYRHFPALKLQLLFPPGHHNKRQRLSLGALPGLLLDGLPAWSPFTIHTFAPAAPFYNVLFLLQVGITYPSFWTQFKCSLP